MKTTMIICLGMTLVVVSGWLWLVDREADRLQQTPFSKGAPVLNHQPHEGATQSTNWPNFLGPFYNCISDGTVSTDWDSNGPPLKWEKSIGLGYSSPIVWEDRLIVTHRIDRSEVIACFNAETGSLFWEHHSPTDFICDAKYTNGPYSTPATDGEFLFNLSAEGVFNCLKLNDGQPVWSCDFRDVYGFKQRVYGAGQSPLIWQGMVIVNVGGTHPQSGIVAFNKSTGEELWTATNHAAGYSLPRVVHLHGQDFLFVLTYDGLVALNPHSGVVHWEIPNRSPISMGENAVTPVICGDLLICCSYGNGTKCLQILENGQFQLLWESRKSLTSQFTPVICHDGFLYGVHCADHTLRCIELTTGKLRWRQRTELKRATAVHLDDQLLLFGEFGHLACLRLSPHECQLRAQTTLSLFDDTFCFASPALSRQRLFLRNEGKLKCFDLRGSESASLPYVSAEIQCCEK